MIDIEVRRGLTSDQAFIFSTWLRAFRFSSQFARKIRSTVFFDGHHKSIEQVLKSPGLQVLIAHPVDDPDTILGYLVAERTTQGAVVHFVYVKQAFRMLGVARKLVEAAGIDISKATFTHLTKDAEAICARFPELTYNPYLFYRSNER